MKNAMISEIIVCSLIFAPQPSDLTEYLICREQEDKIEYVSQWIPLVQIYFPEKEQKTALLVIYCESRGKRTAQNFNANAEGIYKNSYDRGIFQINSVTYDWARGKLKVKNEPFNPYIGAYISAWIVKHFQWKWWASSEHCWGAK